MVNLFLLERHCLALVKYLYFKLKPKDRIEMFGSTERNHLLTDMH